MGEKKAGRKKGDKRNHGRGGKTPQEFMNALVPAGPVVDHGETLETEKVDADFTGKKPYIDPVAFCEAVINNDREVLDMLGVYEHPKLGDRLEAARISVKFTNKPKPVETVSKHQFSWMDTISAAENRVKSLRMGHKNDDDNTDPNTTH